MLDAQRAPDALARPPLPALAIDSPASPARPAAAYAVFAAALSPLPFLEAGWPLDAATVQPQSSRFISSRSTACNTNVVDDQT